MCRKASLFHNKRPIPHDVKYSTERLRWVASPSNAGRPMIYSSLGESGTHPAQPPDEEFVYFPYTHQKFTAGDEGSI